MDAMATDAANTANASRGAPANPFAALFGSAPATSGTAAASAAPAGVPGTPPVPNTSPLPNPWAPSSGAPAGTGACS